MRKQQHALGGRFGDPLLNTPKRIDALGERQSFLERVEVCGNSL